MIFKLASIAGVDPGPRTLRELIWMSHGKRQHDWGLASSIIAAIYEVNRDPRRRRKPFSPADFNPLLKAIVKPVTITVSQLAGLFQRTKV